MDDKIMRELLDEVLSALEGLEAQNLAVLAFLKAQKKGADKLAPYLEQAEKTSGVKWMANRARLNHLLDAALREAERSAETQAKSVMPAAKAEENRESEDKKPKEAPLEERKKLEGSENTSEPRIHEPAARSAEPSSTDQRNTVESTIDKQAGTKSSSENEADQKTESAA